MHQGDILSTLGHVQYIGGYHDQCGGYHEYIRCSVHRRVFSTSEGYHEYIRGYHDSCKGANRLKPSVYIENPDVLNIPIYS